MLSFLRLVVRARYLAGFAFLAAASGTFCPNSAEAGLMLQGSENALSVSEDGAGLPEHEQSRDVRQSENSFEPICVHKQGLVVNLALDNRSSYSLVISAVKVSPPSESVTERRLSNPPFHIP